MTVMNANRREKEVEINILRDHLTRSSSVVVLDFKGIDVETVTALRVAFRKAGVSYRVAKNTLVKQALKGTKLEGNKKLEAFLRGPTGIAFSFEDPTAAAKVVKEFRKGGEKQEKLGIKCGVLDSTVFEGKAVEDQLAVMPGKNEIRGMLLATLNAPLINLLQLLQAPAQNLVYAISAREKQLGE